MKKILTVVAVLVVIGLLSGMAFAAGTDKKPAEVKKPVIDKNTKVFHYGQKVITVKLKDGQLMAMSAHKKDVVNTIDAGVTKFWAAHTGLGPMVAYHQGDLLYLALINQDGNMVYRKQCAKAPYKAVNFRAEDNGAYIHIERLNNDVLVVKADSKGYKYVKIIKPNP